MMIRYASRLLPFAKTSVCNIPPLIALSSTSRSLTGIPGVSHAIAVASGKGGVGKSTTAVNLAVALAQDRTIRVGLLDADVYGPSIHRMMNLAGRPRLDDQGRMIPLENYGIRCMSMGFLMEEDNAAVWRGPMVMSAINTFCSKVDWEGTTILVIDMPPGTGDAQISISQRISLSGAVIVSTPQDIALIDARRGITMFKKVNVPILGIVENQSYYICPNCSNEAHIFGHGGAEKTATEMGVDFLGKIPLDTVIREQSDRGTPIVAAFPDSPVSHALRSIAATIKEKVIGQPTADNQSATPKIVID